MTDDRSEYPWWARSTGGNRQAALGLAVAYTVIGVADSIIGFARQESLLGVIGLGFLLLGVWAWAVFAYLSRRSGESGDRRGR
ncbi:hypothetical protein ACFQ9V_16055 [Leifsonia sp. NPDC056665]|uniref:hypothetical protein n=1 Tax=Leifsonia sp. NPDC056665 TaxID=3345901 RepID=UPI0036B19338